MCLCFFLVHLYYLGFSRGTNLVHNVFVIIKGFMNRLIGSELEESQWLFVHQSAGGSSSSLQAKSWKLTAESLVRIWNGKPKNLCWKTGKSGLET